VNADGNGMHDRASRQLTFTRRAFLMRALALAAWPGASKAASTVYAPVIAGVPIRFPQDEGSHPDFRTEWWYVTGWLHAGTDPFGFQITFFRTRPHPPSGNPSRFDPQELLIAHAAVSERAHGKLRDAQRIARAGFGLAQARTGRTEVWIDDWRLHADGGSYAGRIDAREFALDLRFEPTQAPLLQGHDGYSQKGPNAHSASYYYSLPQLRTSGRIKLSGEWRSVQGASWLDHEWSSEAMDADAAGWDWAGINFDDGSALMIFRMRAKGGGLHWAAATLRTADGTRRTYAPSEVAWTPGRRWRSPRTGATYPVAPGIRVGDLALDLVPMMDDQENDARVSTGAVYWEGAVTALRAGRRVGLGYLELTGYTRPLKL